MTTEKTAADKPKKLSAEEKIRQQLDAARASYAKLEAELKPKMAVEAEKIQRLKDARSAAEKAQEKAYDAYKDAYNKAYAALSRHTKDVIEAARAHAVANGVDLTLIPPGKLGLEAERHLQRLAIQQPEVAALATAKDAAYKALERARREENIATSYVAPHWMMERQLTKARNLVTELEAELEKIPRRREQQREYRKNRREEDRVEPELEKLSVAMNTFTWSPPPKEGDQCPHGAYWYAEVASENPNWPVGTLDIDCDVCRPEVK